MDASRKAIFTLFEYRDGSRNVSLCSCCCADLLMRGERNLRLICASAKSRAGVIDGAVANFIPNSLSLSVGFVF